MRVLTLHLVRMVRFRKTNGIIGTMDRTWSCAIWILGFEVTKRNIVVSRVLSEFEAFAKGTNAFILVVSTFEDAGLWKIK